MFEQHVHERLAACVNLLPAMESIYRWEGNIERESERQIVIKTSPRRTMMTFFFGLLDPRAQTLRFSSAGHLDPYVYRASSGKMEALSSWGFPLGVRRRDPFREHIVEFSAGDRLVLYSDGLTASRSALSDSRR